MAAKKKVDFETAMVRLEEIVGLLDGNYNAVVTVDRIYASGKEQ